MTSGLSELEAMASKGHLPSTGDRPGRGSAAVLAGGHAYGGTLKRTEQKLSRPARPDKAAAALRTAADAIQSGSAAPARLAVVSAADPVDRATGRLVHLPDAPFLVGDLDPAEILAAYVDGPVIVDNDVNWAARAERDALAATPVSDFAYVFLGEGLGAARRNLPSSTSVRNCHHRYPCEAAWPGRPTEPGSPSEGTGEIALLETGSWKIQARFEVEDLVNALAIDPAGRVAVATSGPILTVRSPDGELLHRLDGHLSSISAVGRTADERLFSGGYDGQVIRWDLDGNRPALTVDPGPGAVWDLAIDGDAECCVELAVWTG